MDLPTSVQAARIRLSSDKPYYGRILWSLLPTSPKGEIPFPLGVDSYGRLYVNNELIKDWSTAEIAGVLEHEINHLLRQHPWRHELKQPEDLPRWWIATDCEINDDLLEYGTVLPEPHVKPQLWKMAPDQTAEQYYDQLPETPRIKVSVHGSSADGQTKPWEQGETSKEHPGVSKGRQEILRAQVARDMLQHKQQGHLPGFWEEWIEGILDPKIPWQQVLRQKARQAVSWASGQMDYSYSRPARRQVPGFILPSLRGPQLSAAVIVDTSGSMSSDDLRAALAEVDGIIKQTTGSCVGILCDADVQVLKKIRSAVELADIQGRGGTDMAVGIQAALGLKPRPDWCVVCTDGFTSWNLAPTPFPLVVCLIGADAADPETVPAWAQVVEVRN